MNKTEAKITTRPEAGAQAIETAVTINWDGMTPDDIQALAQQALIVKVQAKWRKEGIPTDANLNATDYRVGVRAPKGKPDIATLISKMTAEEKAALLAKLQA